MIVSLRYDLVRDFRKEIDLKILNLFRKPIDKLKLWRYNKCKVKGETLTNKNFNLEKSRKAF